MKIILVSQSGNIPFLNIPDTLWMLQHTAGYKCHISDTGASERSYNAITTFLCRNALCADRFQIFIRYITEFFQVILHMQIVLIIVLSP